MRMLYENGQAIEGLYAVSTDSMGVLLSGKTGCIDCGGVAHVWCFISGRIAGEQAAVQ